MTALKRHISLNGVKVNDIAAALGIRQETASRKVNGELGFTLKEAATIRAKFFPKYELEELFKEYFSARKEGSWKDEQ